MGIVYVAGNDFVELLMRFPVNSIYGNTLVSIL